jgi:hypothetical protein
LEVYLILCTLSYLVEDSRDVVKKLG